MCRYNLQYWISPICHVSCSPTFKSCTSGLLMTWRRKPRACALRVVQTASTPRVHPLTVSQNTGTSSAPVSLASIQSTSANRHPSTKPHAFTCQTVTLQTYLTVTITNSLDYITMTRICLWKTYGIASMEACENTWIMSLVPEGTVCVGRRYGLSEVGVWEKQLRMVSVEGGRCIAMVAADMVWTGAL